MIMKTEHGVHPVRVIAVASGKGGVGKTNISINLALALADRNHKVTLFDADLGLANIDVLLNLKPLHNLSHVIQGQCDLKDILINGPNDIRIIPGASGVRLMSNLTVVQQGQLVRAFEQLAGITDTMIVDTSAGISDDMVRFCTASQEVLVVVCNDPASVTDAYALIKLLSQDYGIDRFRIVVNMVQDRAEGEMLFKRLVEVSGRYLDVVLKLAGIIPYDIRLLRAVQSRRPFILTSPSSPAAIALKTLADDADKWHMPAKANGMLEFFLDRMVRSQPQDHYRMSV